MGYYSATRLSCTNPEIIASGSTFNQNTNSKLLEVKDGKAFYYTRKRTMLQEICELSEEHPEETFTTTWWWDEDFDDRVEWTGVFYNGIYKEIKAEPAYGFWVTNPENIDKELMMKCREHVMQYVKRIDLIKYDPEKGTEFDFLNDQKDDPDGFKSYYMIVWENSEHKFTATKRFTSHIEVDYVKKKSSEMEGSQKEENPGESDDEYEPLPF